jgi:mRNA-degrading endonuclease YafQ of YafQ-DinJ toxin-antitoxin module
MKKKLYLPFLTKLATLLIAYATPLLAEVSCKVADNAISIARDYRSLNLKAKVPCNIRNKKQVERFLQETIRKEIPEEKLKGEELLGKALGLLPKDFKYKEELINLYLSQLGGYYDPKTKSYTMASWIPEMMQSAIAVHELTHALQDQHFDLEKIVNNHSLTTDAQLARSALVEGDATIVMLDYELVKKGQPKLKDLESIEPFIIQQTLAMSLSSDFATYPDSLKYSLMFPYISGMRFVHSLLRNGGLKAVNKAFIKLPRSTEEVLHPEKYFSSKADFTVINQKDLLNQYGFNSAKVVHSEVLGEFMHSLLLADVLSKTESSLAGAGWGGDLALILERNKRQYLLYRLILDTKLDKKEFKKPYFNKLKRIYNRRITERFDKDMLERDENFLIVEEEGLSLTTILSLD